MIMILFVYLLLIFILSNFIQLPTVTTVTITFYSNRCTQIGSLNNTRKKLTEFSTGYQSTDECYVRLLTLITKLEL